MKDIDIRRALLERVQNMHANEPDTRYLQELGLCRGEARVDVAVVNGHLHGYEIKSERDTLSRLPGQRAAYEKAFDYVTIVAGSSHVEKIMKDNVIPEWWGVWIAETVDGSVSLLEKRRESLNPAVDKLALVQFLWREEALEALDAFDLASGHRSETKAKLWDALVASLSLVQLSEIVREALKSRKNWKADAIRG